MITYADARLHPFAKFELIRYCTKTHSPTHPVQQSMAAGSSKKYALDLNDTFAFPGGNNIPLRPPNTEEGESWVMLLEVGLTILTLPSAVSNAVVLGNMDFSISAKRSWVSPPLLPDRLMRPSRL